MAVKTEQKELIFNQKLKLPNSNKSDHKKRYCYEYKENFIVEEFYKFANESNNQKENHNLLQQGFSEFKTQKSFQPLKIMVLGHSYCDKEKFINSLCFPYTKKIEKVANINSTIG